MTLLYPAALNRVHVTRRVTVSQCFQLKPVDTPANTVTQKASAKADPLSAYLSSQKKAKATTPLVFSDIFLALSLLVFRVLADYSDTSLSFNDFAFFANRFY